MNTKLHYGRGWASSVAKKNNNNWAQTRMAGELWKELLEEASHIFFSLIPVSKCTLKAKTKDDHSLKSDHYTITPTGPMEPLIKILTLQNSSEAKHSIAQHDTASWGLNIDTITTQEEYLTAATNIKKVDKQLLCVSLATWCVRVLGGVCMEEDSYYMCRSETGKALSSSSLICSD